nr:aminotransferase class V-fold PLP-dependent enzyme [Leucobacter coleopterorum]
MGTVQAVQEIAEHAQGLGVPVHTDAVQAAASLPMSFSQVANAWPGPAVDAMTVASHKFGGPQGVGALLVRRHLRLEPILHGGGQEGGARSGTENVVGIVGFAAAVRAGNKDVGTRSLALAASRHELLARVLADVPGARLTGDPEERLPGHASFVVPGVSGESMLVALDVAGFAVSSGSACAAGKDEPSPVLLALGMEPTLAQTAIRFTLPSPLSNHAIERIVEVLRAEVLAARGARTPGR